MTDIRLISILPSTSAVSGATPAATPQGGGSAGSGLAVNFPIGSVLSGFIINRDPQGNPILRTPQGDVLFESKFFLKIGSEVVIRVQQLNNAPTARIVSVDGAPPEVAATKSAFSEPDTVRSPPVSTPVSYTPQTQNTATPRPTIAVPLSSTTSLKPEAATISAPKLAATLIQPPPTTPETPAPSAALPLGTRFFFTIREVVPQGAPTPSISAPPPTTTAPVEEDVVDAFIARVFLPPATNEPAQPRATLPSSILATVIAQEPDGEAHISTPFGTLRITQETALPVGTRLVLGLAANPSAPPPTPLPAIATLATQLPDAISQILALLRADDVSQLLPEAPVNLSAGGGASLKNTRGFASSLMQFVAHLRGGTVRDWLGESAIAGLERRGAHELIQRAEVEFQALSKLTTPNVPQQWQAYFVPVLVDGEAQMVRWFVKRERKQRPNEPEEEDTRFVVDLSLSELGAVQLDGFVRRKSQVQFDLIVRTHQPLPEGMSRDLLALYDASGALTGFSGQIVFQHSAVFPVNPLEELARTGHSVIDV